MNWPKISGELNLSWLRSMVSEENTADEDSSICKASIIDVSQPVKNPPADPSPQEQNLAYRKSTSIGQN